MQYNLLLLPLAIQPTVGFGLSNNVLPFFPICHQLSPLKDLLEDSIEKGLREMGLQFMDSTHLTLNRDKFFFIFVQTDFKFRIP